MKSTRALTPPQDHRFVEKSPSVTLKSSVRSCSSHESEFCDSDFVLSEKHARRLVQAARRTIPNSVPAEKQRDSVTYIHHEQVKLGDVLGVGGFGLVHEVESILLAGESPLGGENRMVCKTMRPHKEAGQLINGCNQLEVERQTLQILDHPNIIGLRGCSEVGLESIAQTQRLDSSFLLLDYLPETLTERIDSWRRTNKKRGLPVWKFSKPRLDNADLLKDQLNTAIDIASALQYLHQKRIILRDLKPDNIGFDENGTVKLFDFGLAAHLPPDCDLEATHAGLGIVGSPRYMATEVARMEPYNHKADVFSFSSVLWHMLTQERPSGHDPISLEWCGQRPTLPKHWPEALRRIISRGWSDDLSERPCMTEYKLALEDLVRRYC